MTKQKMQLPLTCEKHLHDGYGTSKDVPCPWCGIERQTAAILHLQQTVIGLREELRLATEPTTGRGPFWNGHCMERYKSGGVTPDCDCPPDTCKRATPNRSDHLPDVRKEI